MTNPVVLLAVILATLLTVALVAIIGAIVVRVRDWHREADKDDEDES